MNKQEYIVRNVASSEFKEVGKLMVQVYSQLEGFPKESEQPEYYKMLANIGELTKKPETELLVAVSPEGKGSEILQSSRFSALPPLPPRKTRGVS